MKLVRKLVCALTLGLAMMSADAQGIDINSATAPELETLKGIGPSKAQAIVDYRTKNGPFKSVDDLKLVSGIGDKTLEQIRGQVTVGAAADAAPAAPAATPAPAAVPVGATIPAAPANPAAAPARP